MANITITNKYDDGYTTLYGTPGDRLTYNYTIPGSAVWLTSVTPLVGGGYSGTFDGFLSNNVYFSGFTHFTFTTSAIGNDDIHTGDGNDILMSGAGDDTLFSGGGIDQVDGGAGNDLWGANYGTATSTINVNLNGVSTLFGTGYVQNMEGMHITTGLGNDVLIGHQTSGRADLINAGGGFDSMTLWLGGWDTVNGGLGTDRLTLTNNLGSSYGGVTLSNTTVDASGYSGMFDGYSTNNVTFTGIEHFTFVDLSSGTDNIRTGNGNDSLVGGGGNDRLNSAQGFDTIDGGTGNDTWEGDTSFSNTGVTIDINGFSSFLGGQSSVTNVEGIYLTTGGGNDNITGHQTASLQDKVTTGAGHDQIKL
ncbi:MAG: calcium-binding protein, partial [Shimia sp.]|nr:calcium-binding protein [Shimia sp.]